MSSPASSPTCRERRSSGSTSTRCPLSSSSRCLAKTSRSSSRVSRGHISKPCHSYVPATTSRTLAPVRCDLTPDDGSGDFAELSVVVTGIAPDPVERDLHADAEPLGDDPLRLLDHDPAVQRVLQLIGELCAATRGLLMEDRERRQMRQRLP